MDLPKVPTIPDARAESTRQVVRWSFGTLIFALLVVVADFGRDFLFRLWRIAPIGTIGIAVASVAAGTLIIATIAGRRSKSERSSKDQDDGTRGEVYTLQHAEEDIDFYSEYLAKNSRAYRTLAAVSLLGAAAIPIVALSASASSALWTAILGAVVTVSQGLLQTFRYRENWLGSVEAQEALIREVGLYKALAGPYHPKATSEPAKEFAVRTARISADEASRWSAAHHDAAKGNRVPQQAAAQPAR
jgi:hypothetical protein